MQSLAAVILFVHSAQEVWVREGLELGSGLVSGLRIVGEVEIGEIHQRTEQVAARAPLKAARLG